ncbi:MAG: PA2779 family protein [Vicinamibacterales bacterium]
MQMFRRILVTALVVLMSAPMAWAQQTHVVNKSALDQAVQRRVNQEQADRDTLRTFLQNPQVKSVAAKAGLSVEQAEAAVSTLQGDQLRQAAGQASAVNQDLAGGATVVITTTTIIIILLVIIIIAVIA